MKKSSILMLIVGLVVGLGLTFGVYYFFFRNETKVMECPKCENQACNCPNTTCSKKGIKGEQMLFSKIGTVYISENGEVYFNPSDNVTELGMEKDDMVNKTKALLGNSKKYDIKSNKFMEGHYTFGYKLDLSSVQSVSEFYFGNGGVNVTLLFIHDNGNVSELSYDENDLKIYKNVSGYSNIASMVVDQDEGGNGAKLYDKCGNGINYTSPRFKNN